MAEANLTARVRISNKKSYRKGLRHTGKVPAIVYGKGVGGTPVEIDLRDFETTVRQKGRNALINLTVQEGANQNKHVVIIKDMQRDPIRGLITHVDLHQVSLDDKIHATVPVALLGEARGQKNGGVVQSGIREVEVECVPAKIPEVIPVDITSLDIGGHLAVRDLPENPDYRIITDPESVLVTLIAPRMPEAAETEPVETAPAGEKTEEAPAEGE